MVAEAMDEEGEEQQPVEGADSESSSDTDEDEYWVAEEILESKVEDVSVSWEDMHLFSMNLELYEDESVQIYSGLTLQTYMFTHSIAHFILRIIRARINI